MILKLPFEDKFFTLRVKKNLTFTHSLGYLYSKGKDYSGGSNAMEIQFRTGKLRKQYEDIGEAKKAYGEEVARRYIGRINIIKNVNDIFELQRLAVLRCHALKGERKGQWAIKLTGFYRLIFTLNGERLEIVCIEEVSKHYDD